MILVVGPGRQRKTHQTKAIDGRRHGGKEEKRHTVPTDFGH
jgi:hypothetical protein